MSQSCLNRTGQVMMADSPANTLHTPRGFVTLTLVQLGTWLLNGHKRDERWRTASSESSPIGYPNTSARGLAAIPFSAHDLTSTPNGTKLTAPAGIPSLLIIVPAQESSASS